MASAGRVQIMVNQKNPPPLNFFSKFFRFSRTFLAVIRPILNKKKIRIFSLFFTTISFFSSPFPPLFPFFPLFFPFPPFFHLNSSGFNFFSKKRTARIYIPAVLFEYCFLQHPFFKTSSSNRYSNWLR